MAAAVDRTNAGVRGNAADSRPGDGFLFVLNSLRIGGSESKIIRVANALARAGVSVQLAYLNPPETGLGRIDPAVRAVHLQRRRKYSIGALRRLRGLISRDGQTVVAVNRYPLLYVVPAVKWAGSFGTRTVALINTTEESGRDVLLGKVCVPLLRKCDRIVFGCAAQQAIWVRKHGLSPHRSRVIYNGVDHEFYTPESGMEEGKRLRQRLGIPPGAVVVGSVGRIDPEKSYEVLILALARLNAAGRSAWGVIVGSGGMQERLEQLANAKGIGDKVKFPGLLEDVRPAVSAMDIFVLPSSRVETFSNAALEAMAMSRAVVLSEAGGAAEMVEHGKSGMLFPVGGIDALTGILAELHGSSELRQRLGQAARNRVVASFGFADMVDRYQGLQRCA